MKAGADRATIGGGKMGLRFGYAIADGGVGTG